MSEAGGSVYGYYEIDTDKKKGMREVFATRMEREFLIPILVYSLL
ncbi:MAG: hypothetical protein ACLVAW_14755 [Eisenbergiella massiliensis]